jgi:hypothetical protein
MSSIILFLFRSKYRELGLSKRWWHRLAIVLFAVALSAEFLMGVWIIVDDYGQKNIQIKVALNDYLEAKPSSPAEKQAIDQRYVEQYEKNTHDANVTLWLEIGYTLVFLAGLSYLLQLFYRALIYVVYGNKREPEHSSENAV